MQEPNQQIDDGGPAFPRGQDCRECVNDGMSLRDYFAGQALQGLIQSAQFGGELKRIFDADSRITNAGNDRETPQHYTARIALSLADAMLRARKAANE